MADRRATGRGSPRRSGGSATCAGGPPTTAAEKRAPAPPTRHPSNRLATPVLPAHDARGSYQSTSLNSAGSSQNRRISDGAGRQANSLIPLNLISGQTLSDIKLIKSRFIGSSPWVENPS